jgi:hypothetical protein
MERKKLNKLIQNRIDDINEIYKQLDKEIEDLTEIKQEINPIGFVRPSIKPYREIYKSLVIYEKNKRGRINKI